MYLRCTVSICSNNWREFAANRHRSPRTSYEELFEECGGDDSIAASENVSWHEGTAKHAGDHHSQPSPGKRADIANEGAADQCAYLTDDGSDSDLRRTLVDLVLEIRREQVLKVMGGRVSSCLSLSVLPIGMITWLPCETLLYPVISTTMYAKRTQFWRIAVLACFAKARRLPVLT